MNIKTIGTWLLAAAVAALALPERPVQAQRDAGAKLRGDIGRYSGRAAQPSPRATSPRVVSPQPRAFAPQPVTPAQRRAVMPAQPQPAVDPYAAYSLQPLRFEVGDKVRAVRNTHLMRGRRVLGSVAAGQQLRVLRIRGPWIGVVTQADGREVGGWVWYSQVERVDAATSR